MTATQWVSVGTTLACLVLAVVAVRLARRLRSESARTAEELALLRKQLAGLEQGRSTLELLSVTDPVTGVWNHRYLQDALAREIERSTRTKRPFALLMCDVDHFSQVNRAHGHQAGSAVLRELAQRLALEIRSVDTFARYGGEEFLVLLPETDAEGAAAVAERLCYVARKHLPGAQPNQEEIRLTVSIGAAVYPESATHSTTLLRAADQSLAQAKEAGGDCWEVPARAGRREHAGSGRDGGHGASVS
ncbi:MAG TPA: GGDEF domain-containing protein [Actinocrinis sp.]|nr:GGDEF domain-containing protein [Actinocrinis sp.]